MNVPHQQSIWTKPATEALRDELIHHFLMSNGEALSGMELSTWLGVSRTAIWKHIQSLESAGFQFESVRRVGYRLVDVPDLIMEPLLTRALPADVDLGRTVTWQETLNSTNRTAMEYAMQGAPHGLVVSTLVQTGGRGRRGRAWFSPPQGAWFSVVLQRPMPLRRAAELTLISSVILRRVIADMSGLDVQIKWPNDLLVDGKKVTGILAEIRADGEQVEHAVLGIGINCNTPAEDFPDELKPIATSVYAMSGMPIHRTELVARFLAGFEPFVEAIASGESAFATLHAEWEYHSATLGRNITVQSGGHVYEGAAERLSPTGTLILRLADGSRCEINSGDVLF